MRLHAVLLLTSSTLLASSALMCAEEPAAAPPSEKAPEAAPANEPPAIKWEKWSDDLFVRAKKENRLVLLDMEAVWCHWCHVMDEITYREPEVRRLLAARYIAVKVDQDSRPDLSNRYEDYGWPATVIFAPDGQELVKRSGYIPPMPMARLLQAVIDDPTPGPSIQPEEAPVFAAGGALSAELKDRLRAEVVRHYDPERGGWGHIHKYLDAGMLEYSLLCAANGDSDANKRARETLDLCAQYLIDPVWGGLYQYAHGGDWKEPHFEKIMSYQADGVRVFSLAFAQTGEPKYLKAAQDIRRYMNSFLRGPEGAYYVSQDADVVKGEHSAEYFALDDAARRAHGIPRIDTHLYARENGWAIQALCAYYAASGDAEGLNDAIHAAEWVLKNRALPDGGFRHDSADAGGPFLGDTLSMCGAFVALYTNTGDARWLKLAESAAGFIRAGFSPRGDAPAGFLTSHAAEGLPEALAPAPQREEMVQLARTATRLFHYTGEAAHRALAQQAFRYLTAPSVALGYPAGWAILAAEEIDADPFHITVVGAHDNAAAAALFATALKWQPVRLKRADWWDPARGPLRNSVVAYPPLQEPAAFVCGNGRCSLPMKDPEALLKALNKAVAKPLTLHPLNP
jgi:uncharacterized protein